MRFRTPLADRRSLGARSRLIRQRLPEFWNDFALITLRDLCLQRGAKRLFENASLSFFAGQKIGVVGANGSGKSSFFALLMGELHAESGDLEFPQELVVAHVSQETEPSLQPSLDFVLDGDEELRAAEREIAAAESAAEGERLGEAHERYNNLGGWGARARAAEMLFGLGFSVAEHERPLAEFSGGYRMRLNLARALMRRSDLLLLDEPTNHLDLDAVIWLEGWLAAYQGTLFLISHDREFLDAIADHVLHFDHGRLKLYRGNYGAFERQRAASLAQQQAAYVQQQREAARLHRFVERFRAKATKARQAQSRLKALERMEMIAPAHIDTPFTFRFRDFPGSPEVALQLEDAAVGYDDRIVLDSITLAIRRGERIGLLGRNGAGKSTFVKLICGALAARSGERREGKNLRIGYFAQHQLEIFTATDSPLRLLQRQDRAAREQDLRDFLGGFDFHGERVFEPVERMSGGERARLALALIIWNRPNLLLLDEPTNHLDIDMREALAEALQEYEGAMILVSHDRHLLRSCADELLLVADGRVAEYDGDLDDYRRWLAESRSPGTAKNKESSRSRRAERQLEAQARNAGVERRRPIVNRLKKLEVEIEPLAAERARLTGLLASADFYNNGDPDALSNAIREQAQVAKKLERLENEWLMLQEQLEASDQGQG